MIALFYRITVEKEIENAINLLLHSMYKRMELENKPLWQKSTHTIVHAFTRRGSSNYQIHLN